MSHDTWSQKVNPTSCLPRLKLQPEASIVFVALCILARLYSPSSIKSAEKVLLSSFSEEDILSEDPDYQDALDSAQVDESEKRFAMDWITKVIGSGLYWLEEDSQHGGLLSAETLLDLAGRVLGGHAGLEEAGAISRDFSFPLKTPIVVSDADAVELTALSKSPSPFSPLSTGSRSINITLRDDPLPPSRKGEDGTDDSQEAAQAVGVQTWASSVILSDLIVRYPTVIHRDLDPSASRNSTLEVAELGAGTGLVGMVTAKYLDQIGAAANIVLTDYHQKVLENLRYNVGQSFPASPRSPHVTVEADRLDWKEIHEATVQGKAVERKRYDLLLLADVVYAREHAVWIRSSIEALLKKPDGRAQKGSARAHVMTAIRMDGKFEGISRTVEDVFSAELSATALPSLSSTASVTPEDTMPGTPSLALEPPRLETESRKHSDLLHSRIDALNLNVNREEPRISIIKKRKLKKQAGLGRPDEQGYFWFEIGWTV